MTDDESQAAETKKYISHTLSRVVGAVKSKYIRNVVSTYSTARNNTLDRGPTYDTSE